MWVRLDLLKQIMDAKGGYVPLPTIFNGKTVDPQQDTSTPVWQLETAMGAAIECFANSNAVCVSRERFAPVKKCSDLLLLKSDAYVVNSNNVLVLNPEINAAPVIALDDKKYKLIQQLDMNTRYGIPSLKKCKKLTVIGDVWFNRNVVINGTVTVINNSDEPKMLPPGQYADGSTVDLTDTAPGLGPLRPFSVVTKPYLDQKPGTSGLRKKTKQFEHSEHYLHNFIQSTFNALSTVPIGGVNGTVTDIQNDGALVIGGDGRYFNSTAIQVIIKMAVANGVRHIIVGQDGLLSTPAVSALIRESGPQWRSAFGAFILTASHNPGGPDEDFGIKYNINNGGPAPDVLTNEIFNVSKTITNFKICNNLPTIDLSKTGSMSVTPTSITHSFTTHDANGSPIANTTVTKMSRFECNKNPANVTIDVISSTDIYLKLLQTVFDFKKISGFLKRDDVSFVYDCMHGVQGPYAHEAMQLLVGTYAVRSNCRVMNGIPSETFGGHHADPNLTYARDVCDVMGVDKNGNAQFEGKTIVEPAEVAKLVQENVNVPILGVAADGDADRNMILGRHFFVTPSDSLAIIASHANLIPYFKLQGGLKSVARSMPTSGAIDVVAKHKNYHLFETPTGWKYFGNVMDSKKLFQGMNYNPVLCGEESFGTGSDHVREKDGLWAVLSWLSILAHFNSDANVSTYGTRIDVVGCYMKLYSFNIFYIFHIETTCACP